jgi:hypothetical protein
MKCVSWGQSFQRRRRSRHKGHRIIVRGSKWQVLDFETLRLNVRQSVLECCCLRRLQEAEEGTLYIKYTITKCSLKNCLSYSYGLNSKQSVINIAETSISETGFTNLRKYEVIGMHIHRWMKQSGGRVEEVKRCVKQIVKQGKWTLHMKQLGETK